MYLHNKAKYARFQTRSITYYYSPPTCFGHSCDHHQGAV